MGRELPNARAIGVMPYSRSYQRSRMQLICSSAPSSSRLFTHASCRREYSIPAAGRGGEIGAPIEMPPRLQRRAESVRLKAHVARSYLSNLMPMKMMKAPNSSLLPGLLATPMRRVPASKLGGGETGGGRRGNNQGACGKAGCVRGLRHQCCTFMGGELMRGGGHLAGAGATGAGPQWTSACNPSRCTHHRRPRTCSRIVRGRATS